MGWGRVALVWSCVGSDWSRGDRGSDWDGVKLQWVAVGPDWSRVAFLIGVEADWMGSLSAVLTVLLLSVLVLGSIVVEGIGVGSVGV